ARLPADASGSIRVEPPMLDGLSYPLTLARALLSLRLKPPPLLTILVIGASSKAEERLLHDSNYWEELLLYLPHSMELLFVGPEIAPASHRKRFERAGLRGRAFRGTLGQLLREEPSLTPHNSIAVGFNTGNCLPHPHPSSHPIAPKLLRSHSPQLTPTLTLNTIGMGSGLYPLMSSWLPDLLSLLHCGMVAIFSCANDYSDLKGELKVWQLLHANLILPPTPNPFKAATVVREDARERCEWSCSSCFVYAICGRTTDAPPMASDEELQSALRKLARKHKRTQTPSDVP
ncbi:MAG: hypothetical protein SGPRY_012036, partial [Prymnesium sp.]